MKYQNIKAKKTAHNLEVQSYRDSKAIKKLLNNLVRINPDLATEVAEFWLLREQLKHLSRVLDNRLRDVLILRVGELNPLKKLIR